MIGREIEAAAEPRVKNLLSIVQRAHDRGGDAEGGEAVHPRILNHLLQEGSWIDDEVHQEYVAGALLTARATDPDDEQLEILASVTAMTGRQIRLHHACHWALAQHAKGQDWGRQSVRAQHSIQCESEAVMELLHANDAVVSGVVDSLSRRDMLEVGLFNAGPDSHGIYPSTTEFANPFLGIPTILGIRTFLSGYAVRGSADDLNLIDWSIMTPIGPTLAGPKVRPT